MKRLRFTRLPALAALLLLFIAPVRAHADEGDPGPIVQDAVNKVLSVLGDHELDEAQKREKVYALVEDRIDFEDMSRRILALNWKSATEDQRRRFQELFRHILLDTYWVRIRNYTNERVEVITGMIEGNNFATVDTVVITQKVEIPISYRLQLVNGKWMAYDFLVESLSLVTNYRSQYRDIIQKDGMDGLLQQMQAEVDKIGVAGA